jgi:hypothetical protein
VPVFTSLAAYRFNPNRKTSDEKALYQEIGFPLPSFFKIFMRPFRFFFTSFLRKFRISSKIIFEEKTGKWIYYRGLLENGFSSLKPSFIDNKKLK